LYDRSIELKDSLPIVFVRRGLLKEHLGRAKEAEQDLQGASTDYLPGQLNLALFLIRRGRHAEALALAEKLKNERPEYSALIIELSEKSPSGATGP
jgi:hypothetical protein